MRRREFIAGFSALALPWARAAAQTPGRGVACPLPLGNLTPETAAQIPVWGAIFEELRTRGFVLGDNLRFEFSTVDAHFERMPEAATAVVRSKPDVIFSPSNEFARAMKDSTSTIPVVAWMNEAVVDGFAKSFARPGGGQARTHDLIWNSMKQ